MKIYKILPLLGIIFAYLSANEVNVANKSKLKEQKEETPKITVYSLFVKNPSYQRLYENITKIDKEKIETNNTLDEVLKEAVAKEIKVTPNNSEVKVAKGDKRLNSKNYKAFIKSAAYPKTFAVYKDEKLLKLAKNRSSKIIVDKKTQRIKLVVNGKVAIDSPCTTGARKKIEPHTKVVYNKETPSGVFKIQEKIANKKSSIFGKLYRYGKMVFKGDRRKYHGPPAKYEGATLKNWMRLTSSGIGIHGSRYVKRHPASNGCIRVPYSVVGKIFSAVKPGTKVVIR